MQDYYLAFNIVSNPIVADPVPPLADLDASELLAAVRIGLDAFERLEDLALDFLGELAKVVLEPLGRDEAERRHLAASGVDGPDCLQATDLPSLVLAS